MIPKAAPWKTSALNEQTFTVCEFSTVTSGTERERGCVGTFLAPSGNSYKKVTLTIHRKVLKFYWKLRIK